MKAKRARVIGLEKKSKEVTCRDKAIVYPSVPAKQKKKRDWQAYEASQVRRFSLDIWFDQALIDSWYTLGSAGAYGKRQRPFRFSSGAILATLGASALFKYPLRGAEHFANSLLGLMGYPELKAPDHTTLSRARRRLRIPNQVKSHPRPRSLIIDGTGMKIRGPGEYLKDKHKLQTKAQFRRLTVCLDYDTGEIVSHTLVPSEGAGNGETNQVKGLLDSLPKGDTIKDVIFDRLYDAREIYQTVGDHGGLPIIQPQSRARYGLHDIRDNHIKTIGVHGVAEWKKRLDYHRRSFVESGISRIKQLTGSRLQARSFPGQEAEMAIRIMALNKINDPSVQLRSS